jgi:hypothetical protein
MTEENARNGGRDRMDGDLNVRGQAMIEGGGMYCTVGN